MFVQQLGQFFYNERGIYLEKDGVLFNGIGDNSHETFGITKDRTGFQFTKTQLKPYDKHVYACLVIAKHYFDHIVVSGDGDEDDYPELTPIIKSIIRDKKINDVIDGTF